MTISVNLGKDIEARLAHLAEATGRTKTFYLRQLVEEHLDDLEDVYLAQQVLERVRRGEESVHSAADVRQSLGLGD